MEVNLHQNVSLGANLAKPSTPLVAYVAGGLLLLAAVAKTVQGMPPLWMQSMLGHQAVTVTVIAVAVEAALGTLLILRSRSRPVLRLAAGYYAILAISACGLLVSGVRSCGCFGHLTTGPMILLVLDLGLAAYLWFLAASLPVNNSSFTKKVLLVACVPAAVMGASLFRLPAFRVWTTRPTPLPKIYADSTSYDFGTLTPADASQTHTFNLFNPSNQAITIGDVRTTCGCTVAQIAERTIAPHSTLAIPITVDWSQKVGAVNESVEMAIEGPDSYTLELDVSGSITVPLRISAKKIDFGYLKAGESAIRHFRVANLVSDPTFSIHSIQIDGNDAFAILDPDYHPSGHGLLVSRHAFDIPLRFSAGSSTGTNTAQMIIKTSDSRCPTIVVQLTGKVW